MRSNHAYRVCTFSILFFTLITGVSVFSGISKDISIEPPQGTRDKLTAEDLLSGSNTELVHNDYFMPIGDPLPSAHQLCGMIHFSEAGMTTNHPDSDWKGSGQRMFPAFSLPVVSFEGHLIPLKRGIIYSGDINNSFWNIIVSPGRVWQEPGDSGYSRASFPFALTDNYIGQARNGIATFVFNSLAISSVAIQITQETAPVDGYVLANFIGTIPAQYSPQAFEDVDEHILHFEEERAKKPLIRLWSELPYSAFTQSFFRGGLQPDTVSMAALFLDDQLYTQSTQTRTGSYPYPAEMRHGVFSVTKSLGMGLAMFYAAERYGEDIFDELITDHVPILSDHPGWQGVTFENVFGMSTGTRGSDQGNDIVPFINARSAEEKIAAINVLPDSNPEPGEEFHYASTHTFVLSFALNQYVKAKEGPDADYWELVRGNVLKPLGIEHLALTRTIEEEGRLGIPIMGWGSYPNVCEAAKIGKLLCDEGRFQDKQLLNRNKVREALYRTSKTGLGAGTSYGHAERYIHSMWIAHIALTTCEIHAPAMSGHGGNRVVMLPSGVVAIRFSDANFYDIAHMVAVAELYRSSCPLSTH
jgi:CubicO group peptidase (beta-lactamase class C family)